jgi:hypothetical protein
LKKWTESNLRYYDDDDDFIPSTCFESDTEGEHIFRAIWEFCSAYSTTPQVHEEKWKMKIKMDCEGKPITDDDEVENFPVEVRVAMSALSHDSEGNPEKFRVEFLQKEGNKAAFLNFYQECLTEKLYMFVDNAEAEE